MVNSSLLASRAESQRDELLAQAERIVLRAGGAKLSVSDEAKVENLERAAATADIRATRYRRLGAARSQAARVRREALTYRPDVRLSWFVDQARAQHGDPDAAQRLRRHKAEMAVEIAERAVAEERAFRTSLDKLGAEYRTNPNRTDGTGGDLVPPLWLIDSTAMQVAPSRPLANLVGSVPLPPGTDSINVPAFVSGNVTAMQTADGASGHSSDETDTSAAAPVVTVQSYSDVAMQLLDQVPVPGLDALLFKSAMVSANGVLETQLVSGLGTAGAITGLLNVASVGSVTYTDASPTPGELYPAILKAIATVNDARDLPAEVVLMRGARWAWLCSAVSSDGMLQNAPGRGYLPSVEDLRSGDLAPIGPLAGHPTYIDNAIPATLGAGSNQDAVIVTRPSDSCLWEGAPTMQVAFEPLSGTMQARILTRWYVAFTGAVYPSATAAVIGTGLIVQSGW